MGIEGVDVARLALMTVETQVWKIVEMQVSRFVKLAVIYLP